MSGIPANEHGKILNNSGTAVKVVDLETTWSDTVDLVEPVKAFYIPPGGEGNVHFRDLSDNEFTIEFAVGYHPIGIKRLYETGTTATVMGLI